jgi:hypothetical protein
MARSGVSRHTCIGLAGLCIIALLSSSNAHAFSLAICDEGGAGSTKQAKNAVETFLRHTETSAGLETGSLTGEYHTSRQACEAYVTQSKSVLLVADLATFLRHIDTWNLKPMAHMGASDAIRYHVLVRQGEKANLDALKGTSLLAVLPEDSAYASKIVLGGKLDTVKDLHMSHTQRALKALRALARGKVDAAIVDQVAYEHLAELELPQPIASIYQSEGLPGLSMAVVGNHEQGHFETVKKIQSVLPKLCESDGRKLCKTFGVTAFHQADAETYRRLSKRYQAP